MKLFKNINTLILLSLVTVLYCCRNGNETFLINPIKHYKNNICFKGDGYYRNGVLELVIAFNENRDTILIDSLKNGKLNGTSREFYANGNLKKIGNYKTDQKIGLWKEYYESGELMRYDFWGSLSNQIYYHKKYTKSGILETFKLPLKYTLNTENEILYVGEEYEINIDLLYSEFDSVAILGLIEQNDNLEIRADTLSIRGSRINLKLKPRVSGNETIRGSITEYDYLEFIKTGKEPEYVPEQSFSYNFEVKDKR